MKKSKGIFKFFFLVLLTIYTFLFFVVNAGYYEYESYSKKRLTDIQIKKFEQDIKNGVRIDLENYYTDDDSFNTGEKRLGLKISLLGSKLIKKGINTTFDLVSKLVNN